jgi:hypothetical protein
MPRKTKEQKEAFSKALTDHHGNKHYSYLQISCQLRRMQITAYLNLYAQIRNRAPHATPENYDTYNYNRYATEAQELFDQATQPATA